jgi:ABC-2 type transport system ATP-binding protein
LAADLPQRLRGAGRQRLRLQPPHRRARLYADDLVVVGAGRLLAAEPVAAITARNAGVVVVQTVDATHLTQLGRRLTEAGIAVQTTGTRLHVHDSDRRVVAELAHRNDIPLLELSETSRSLEDVLLDLTASSAEFASA